MSRDWRLFVDDVIAYADAALRLSAGLTRAELSADERTRFAVLHALGVIGEAVKRLPPEARARAPEVPWTLIAGFRDRLAHAYWATNLDVVWSVLTRDLEPLRDAAVRIRDAATQSPPS